MTQAVTDTFDGIFNKMKGLFVTQPIERQVYPELDQCELQQRNKQAFSMFIEKMTADIGNDEDDYAYNYTKIDPTALMSAEQLAGYHGRRIESHVVKSRDGYLLTLHRIIKRNPSRTRIANDTVLLHHGLLGSSADWILLGPEKSLPYILSDQGYDVWMVNARGNYYSRGHVALTTKSPRYWKFSFQEMGEYDLPAIIDYILDYRNSTKEINYIGHCMGGTALLVLLSTIPLYNNYIRIAILLAPLAFMSNIQGPFNVLTTMANNPPEHLLRTIGDTEFLPSRKIPRFIAKKFCEGPRYFCSNPLLFFTGNFPRTSRYNASFIARLLYHVPAGASTNTILHYGQLVKNQKFHRFNQEWREFPLQQVTAAVVLFSSSDDILAPVADMVHLFFSIANPLDHYVINNKSMGHSDFVWGAQAHKLVFPVILDYLENGLIQEILKDNEV